MSAGQAMPEPDALMVYARTNLNMVQQHNRSLEEILVLMNGSDISPPAVEPPGNLQGLLDLTGQELVLTEALLNRIMVLLTGPGTLLLASTPSQLLPQPQTRGQFPPQAGS